MENQENEYDHYATKNLSYPSYEAFLKSKYHSIKHDNFFAIYENVFEKYRDKPIVFVEVGVFHGGSLFMWKEYFGDKARIIGIDLDPSAKMWENYGFEIHIGDQTDPDFWKSFFEIVGPIDILLDDGGHTNKHQIVSVNSALANIKDGGVLVVEDVYTSYRKDYGNPSPYSFINYCKRQVDIINSRFGGFETLPYRSSEIVWSISFFESVVCFQINRKLAVKSKLISNMGLINNVSDYRYEKINPMLKGLRLLNVLLSNDRITIGNRNEWFFKFNNLIQSDIFLWVRRVLQPLRHIIEFVWTASQKILNRKLKTYF